MHAKDIRRWLGLYVLILAGIAGAYFLLAPPILVPLEQSDRTASAEILLPFLLGQIAAVYRYFADPSPNARRVALPVWVIRAPPLIVLVLVTSTIGMLIVAGITHRVELTPSPESVRGALTFAVALLNASSVYVISKYFEAGSKKSMGIAEQKSTTG